MYQLSKLYNEKKPRYVRIGVFATVATIVEVQTLLATPRDKCVATDCTLGDSSLESSQASFETLLLQSDRNIRRVVLCLQLYS